MNNLELALWEWLRKLAVSPGTAYVQVRKFFTNLSWDVPFEDLMETPHKTKGLKLTDLGYVSAGAKRKQLARVYFNEPEILAANRLLRERMGSGNNRDQQTCITSRLGASKKRDDSQGYCMQSITASYLGPEVTRGEPYFVLRVQYRTTELLQKFIADLFFLRETIIPALLEGIEDVPTRVEFHFPQAYFHLQYTPILWQFRNPADAFDDMKHGDPIFYRQSCQNMGRLLEDGVIYNYRSQRLMYELFRERILPTLPKSVVARLVKHVKQGAEMRGSRRGKKTGD